MKRKCELCQGKGGWLKSAGRFTVFLTCHQCNGKGRWWANNRPKPKRKK